MEDDQLIIRDLILKGVIVGSRKMFVNMLEKLVEHYVRPVIDHTYSFKQANEALCYVAKGEKIGQSRDQGVMRRSLFIG